MAHYKIIPLEKKSISIEYEMFRVNQDESISWFNIYDHYRWGYGFIDGDSECNLMQNQNNPQMCAMDQGEYESCEFEDRTYCSFEFSDDIPDHEQKIISDSYYNGGAGWIFDDPDNEWEMEDHHVVILAPYRVEFCDENGAFIREVKTRSYKEYRDLMDKLGPGWYVPTDAALEPIKE